MFRTSVFIACAGLTLACQAGAQIGVLTLADALQRVRDNHPLVRAAAARVDAARGSRTTAGSLANPLLQYMVDDTPIPGRGPIPMDREAMTTLMIPLDAVSQRGPRVARADADVRLAQADANARTIALSLEAARAYYRVASAQVGVAVTRDLSAWLDSLVRYNGSRVAEGIAAEADLIRSQLERDRLLADLAMQEAELSRERAMLASFVGPGQLTVAITDRPLAWQLDALGALLSRDASLLVDATPQVRVAAEHVGSASAATQLERRMLFRDFSAMLGAKQTAGFTSLIAGASVSLPLFSQNRGEIARAYAELRGAQYELAAAQRSGAAEVSGAYGAARSLLDRMTLLSTPAVGEAIPAMLARADESRRIALGAYREGAVPLLGVLDAARAWADARMAYYRALFAQHESMLALAAALGSAPEQVLTSPAPQLQVVR